MRGPVGRWINRPCRVVTPGEPAGRDAMGDPLSGVDVSLRSVCEVQQVSVSEDRGDVVDVQKWRVFLLPAESASVSPRVAGAGVDAGRSIEVTGASMVELDDGRVFTLDGGVWDARHPRTGALSHVEADARLVI